MRLPPNVRRRLRGGWQQTRLYLRQRRADHRVVHVGHGEQPQYDRKMRRMLTRLFR